MDINLQKDTNYILHSLDKYYTNQSLVKKCLEAIDVNDYDFVIEPSAGAGAFYNSINHSNKLGMDIVPEHKDIKEQNWFDYEVPSTYERALVIGNPPFGNNHRLSKKFIQHALQFSNVKTIAFILPNTYKKYTRQGIIPEAWRIKNIIDCGHNGYIIGDKTKHIPSAFFVFDKSNGEDLRTPKFIGRIETQDFSFGNASEYDMFVFGSAPKRVIEKAKPNNRGYYLKAKIPNKQLKEKIQQVDWKGHSGVSGGLFWLNKAEFVEQYIAYYNL